MHVLAEQDVADLVEHEDQPIGEQHLAEVIAAIEALDERAFEQQARDEGDRDAADERDEEAAGLERDPVAT